jgi:hypothetical protein
MPAKAAYTFSDATLLYAKHVDLIAQVRKLADQDLARFADALKGAIAQAVAPHQLQTNATASHRNWYLAPEAAERGLPSTPCLYAKFGHDEVPRGKLMVCGFFNQASADALVRAQASAKAVKAKLPRGAKLEVKGELSDSSWSKDHFLEMSLEFGREGVALEKVAAPIGIALLAMSSSGGA